MDSNHRSQRQQIYSLPPLAARESHRLERVKGIEPSQSAWKADVLPLNYTRIRYGSEFTTLLKNVKPTLAFFITFLEFFRPDSSLSPSHTTEPHSHKPDQFRCRVHAASQNPLCPSVSPDQTKQDPRSLPPQFFRDPEDETPPQVSRSLFESLPPERNFPAPDR